MSQTTTIINQRKFESFNRKAQKDYTFSGARDAFFVRLEQEDKKKRSSKNKNLGKGLVF